MMKTENSKARTPSGRTPWGLVFLFFGAGIVVSFQVGKAPPVLPAIRQDLHMSLFWAGWILSAFSVIGLILGSITGAISDAFGHRRVLIGGLLLQAIGSLTGSFSTVSTALLLTRILEGLGYIMVAVSVPSLIIRITQPRDLRFALSLWSCWIPAGTSTMMFLTPIIISPFGWRGLWLVNAIILAGYSLLVAKQKNNGAAEPAYKKKGFSNQLWRDVLVTSTSTGPVLLAVIFSTYSLQWLGVMGFLPTLLIENFGLSPAKASLLTGLTVAVNVPGNLAGGWLLQRGFRQWRLIASASFVMGLCSLAIYSNALPFPLRYLACLIFSATGGVLPASVFSGVPTHAPKAELMATTNGLIVQGSQLGQVIGPPLLALIVSRLGGWQAAPLLLGVAAFLGTVLSFGLALLERSASR